MSEPAPIRGMMPGKPRFTIGQLMVVTWACGLLLAFPLLLIPEPTLAVAFCLRGPEPTGLQQLQFAVLLGVAIMLALFAFLVQVLRLL
jgi:hypothetical protein